MVDVLCKAVEKVITGSKATDDPPWRQDPIGFEALLFQLRDDRPISAYPDQVDGFTKRGNAIFEERGTIVGKSVPPPGSENPKIFATRYQTGKKVNRIK